IRAAGTPVHHSRGLGRQPRPHLARLHPLRRPRSHGEHPAPDANLGAVMSPSQPLLGSDSGLEYAAEQAKLGIHYCQLSTGDRAANLAQAIACFKEALRFRTAEAAPLDYAKTQNSLGNAYAALPGPDWTANLERAIACYTEALRFGTAEAAPRDY